MVVCLLRRQADGLGAHHVDIATWALGKTDTGPITVDPIMVKHPVEFKDGFPTDDARYNTATEFLIKATFADGLEIDIRHDGDNGILFEGTAGQLFVSRGRLTGAAVEELKSKPLPEGALEKVYKNRPLVDHYRNFFEAVVATEGTDLRRVQSSPVVVDMSSRRHRRAVRPSDSLGPEARGRH